MHNQADSPITQILAQARDGDGRAIDQLLPLVYDEMRALARARMADEQPGQTLQPTALVHEAYIRLVEDKDRNWENRRHFFSAAAQAMRRILIEKARAKLRLKRGERPQRVTLNDDTPQPTPDPEEMLALHEALERLQTKDAEMAQVVELRYFLGLKLDETARVMDSSERTVSRLWTRAKAWLSRELAGGCQPASESGPTRTA